MSNEIRSTEDLTLGREVFYISGRRYDAQSRAKVIRNTATTVTIQVTYASGTTRDITFNTYAGFNGKRFLNGERKTKANEFPEQYSYLVSIEEGLERIARQQVEKRLQDARRDVEVAMDRASRNMNAENLSEVKRTIGVLEDLRAENA